MNVANRKFMGPAQPNHMEVTEHKVQMMPTEESWELLHLFDTLIHAIEINDAFVVL